MTALLLVSAALAAPVPKADAAPSWAEFRGPDGVGHYTGPAVPTRWGTDTHVGWKTDLPGVGWSSPVLLNGKLYLTTAVPKGDNFELRVLCVDAKTGAIDWDKLAFTEDGKATPQPHKKNSHASPTPVTDGERIYVHFGHMGTAAYTPTGEQVWATQEYTYKPVHGNGGSPILADGKLVFSCDGGEEAFVVALDAKTGQRKWKTDRQSKADKKFSFATAQLIEHQGRKLIVSPASDFVAAYDPESGAEVWRARYPKPGWSCVCRPVYTQGLVVVATGFTNQHLIAIDPAGKGDVTDTHVKWTYKKHAPNTPTPLVVGGELYSVSDSGMMSCLDAKTGKVHWEERLKGGGYSASPVLLNGKIYVTSESGVGLVIEPGTTGLTVLAESDLKEKTFATFVPAAGAMYVRTESKLFQFAEKK
jgi:outer membrane protein assembly factor BamB